MGKLPRAQGGRRKRCFDGHFLHHPPALFVCFSGGKFMRRFGKSVYLAGRFAARITAVMFAMLFAMHASPGEAFTLSPAEPQPDAGALRPGLSVDYAYGEAKWLDQAQGWAGHPKPGAPLEGFVYGDTVVGEKTFTSDTSEYVIAFITGFMKFEAGTHELEFQSNDGLRVTLGGVQVYEHDGRHKCETKGAVLVTAPKTAWYPVTALYFNRKFTACLDLSIRSGGGDWDFTSPEMYAHLAK